MPLFPRKVAIVAAGDSRIATQTEYREQAELFARLLNGRTVRDGNTEVKRFEAVVFDTPEEALEHLNVLGMQKHSLVFVSKEYLELAKKIAKLEGRRIRVSVITGLPPDDEVFIIPKGRVSQRLHDLIAE